MEENIPKLLSPKGTKINIDIKCGKTATYPATWDGVILECRGCGEEMGYAISHKGSRVPIDIPDDDGSPVESHFTTCPKASEFRRAK